eukprot:gene15760-17349_t
MQAKFVFILATISLLGMGSKGEKNPSITGKSNLTAEELEEKLQTHLFKNYARDVHPIGSQNSSDKGISVIFDVQVIRILQVNERHQFIQVYLWVNQYWTNKRLGWDLKEFPGVTSIYVQPEKVWVPDIVLYNSVDGNGQYSGGLNVYKHKVRMDHSGKMSWLNPVVFKSICEIDVSYFPFDDQKCKLKFGSWAHDASRIQMNSPSTTSSANSYYVENGEWHLLSITTKENIKNYQCCKNPFADVTVTMKIRRQAINYTLTLILPCALLSSLVVLGFILPPESGERIGLSITVLLAVTVFQQLTSQIMPPYDFPYLAQYYMATIMETGLSLVVTTLILNFYHRSYRQMPWLLRKIILDGLGPILFCRQTKQEADEDVSLDGFEDDLLHRMKQARKSSIPQVIVDWNSDAKIEQNGANAADVISSDDDVELLDNRKKNNCCPSRQVNGNSKREKKGVIKFKLKKLSSKRHSSSKSVLGKSIHETAFTLLGNETKEKITTYEKKRRKELERKKRSREWLKAARVLDRLFLVLFVIVSSASLLIIFFRAPRFSRNSDQKQ